MCALPLSLAPVRPEPWGEFAMMPPDLPARLEPMWNMISQEVSPACMSHLRPHLGAFFKVADVLDEFGKEQLRNFVRCIGRTHERAEQAENAARHWQHQWDSAFGHSIVQKKNSEDTLLAMQAEVLRAGDEVAVVRAERDRLVQEVGDLQETMRNTSLTHLTQQRAREQHMRHAENASRRCMGTSEEERRAVLRRFVAEQELTQHLRMQVQQLQIDLVAARDEKARVVDMSRAAENYALDARSFVQKSTKEALDEQRGKHTAEITDLRNHQSSLLEPAEVLAILGCHAELWRCAAAAHVGLHGNRAQVAVHELLRASRFLGLDSDLVQEPLRRALGDTVAADMGRAYSQGKSNPCVATNRASFGAVLPDTVDGEHTLRLRGFLRQQQEKILGDTVPLTADGGAVSLRQFLPVRARPPILQSENR